MKHYVVSLFGALAFLATAGLGQTETPAAPGRFSLGAGANIDEKFPIKFSAPGLEGSSASPQLHLAAPFEAVLEVTVLEFQQPTGGMRFSHWTVDGAAQEKGNPKVTIRVDEGITSRWAQAVYVYASGDGAEPKKAVAKPKYSGVELHLTPAELHAVLPWSAARSYQPGDRVLVDGVVYAAAVANTRLPPKTSCNDEGSWRIAGSPLPIARFLWQAEMPAPGVPVQFDAALSLPSPILGGTIADYLWDFGDGRVASGRTVAAAFPAGDHIVTLTVVDQFGQAARKAQIVSVTTDGRMVTTPPMGWNSYNYFGNLTEKAEPGKTFEDQMIETVDALVASGMRELGYRYISIDYDWAAEARGPDGRMRPNPSHFPHGIDYLIDYIHRQGFKAGIYLTAGLDNITYDNKPGSIGHETIDARTIAEWGFDYLKYDCRVESGQKRDIKAEMIAMSLALRASGRPIVFSMCEHGRTAPWEWAAPYASLWRIFTDVRDGMVSHPKKYSYVFNDSLNDPRVQTAAPFSAPGAINDPDFLVVGLDGHGSGGLTTNSCTSEQYRAQFSLWCVLSAPLIMGNDFRHLTPENLATLRNAELISVNQDPLVKGGHRIGPASQQEVWVKSLVNGGYAVALYNRSAAPASITAHWTDLGVAPATAFKLRDLWQHAELGEFHGAYTTEVPAYSCVVVRLEPMAAK